MAPQGTSRFLLDFLPQNFRYVDATDSFPQCENLEFSLDMAKRERVTLEQLARYDDILTDVLVDHVCVSITENSSSFHWLISNPRCTFGRRFGRIGPSIALLVESPRTT